MAKKAAKKSSKAKSQTLPGFAETRIPELDAAIEEYIPLRDARVAASTEEIKAKKKVLDLAKKHGKALRDDQGVLNYKTEHDDVMTLTPTEEKLKVKSPQKPDPNESEPSTEE